MRFVKRPAQGTIGLLLLAGLRVVDAAGNTRMLGLAYTVFAP